MKLWDSLTTCLILLLSAVHAGPPPRSRQQPAAARSGGRAGEDPLEGPPVQIRVSITSSGDRGETPAGTEKNAMEKPLQFDQFEDVVEFIKVTISRIRRSPSPTSSSPLSPATSDSKQNLSSRTRHRRERKSKGPSQQSGERRRSGGRGRGGRGGGGRGQGCALKQIHLNVSDLGLGYRSGEEMIFRYCSGPCRKSETNYDKILYSLAHNRRFPPRDAPPQACCRPIAFDDDLSFLDDNLVYHTVRKHSARKCGCV